MDIIKLDLNGEKNLKHRGMYRLVIIPFIIGLLFLTYFFIFFLNQIFHNNYKSFTLLLIIIPNSFFLLIIYYFIIYNYISYYPRKNNRIIFNKDTIKLPWKKRVYEYYYKDIIVFDLFEENINRDVVRMIRKCKNYQIYYLLFPFNLPLFGKYHFHPINDNIIFKVNNKIFFYPCEYFPKNYLKTIQRHIKERES